METHVESSGRARDPSEQLLRRLKKFKGKHRLLVLASSSDSVELAKEIARELGGRFEKLLVKKLVDPQDPRITIGAVTEWAGVYLGKVAEERGYDLHSLNDRINGLVEEMQRYRRQHPVTVTPEGHSTIFVDVGSRSGYRLMAALQSVKTMIPTHIVVATPEISHRAFALINNLCDEVIALKVTSSRS